MQTLLQPIVNAYVDNEQVIDAVLHDAQETGKYNEVEALVRLLAGSVRQLRALIHALDTHANKPFDLDREEEALARLGDEQCVGI